MKFVRNLCVSGSIFVLLGINPAYSTETNTASNVLGNLLTSTAGAIVQNQQLPQNQPSQSTTQSPLTPSNVQDNQSPLTPEAGNQQTTALSPDSGESVLPNFDDLASDEQKQETPPAVPGTQAVSSKNAQMIQNTQPAPIPQSSSQSGLLASSQPENASMPAPTAPETSATTRKVGFIDSDGNVLIAPADMIFPTEMRDGNLYIFSTDIDATKKKLAEEAQNSPQFFPQTNEQSAFPQRNASAPNTFVPMPGQSGQTGQPTQNALGSQIAGQAVNQVSGQVPGQTSQQTPEQTFPGAKNGEWAYNPENPQNDGRSPNYPRRGQQGNAQQATDQTGDTQQAGSQLGNPQQKFQPSGPQQPGGYPQQQGQRGNSQIGLPGMPNRDQNGNVIPSYSPQQGTSGAANPGTSGKVLSSNGNTSNIVNKKPIMFQCYLA